MANTWMTLLQEIQQRIRILCVYLIYMPFTVVLMLHYNFLRCLNPSGMKTHFIKFNFLEEDNIEPSKDLNYLCSTKFVRKRFMVHSLNARRKAFVGHIAPNPTLHDLAKNKPVCLLDYQVDNRPLVLMFGNCT